MLMFLSSDMWFLGVFEFSLSDYVFGFRLLFCFVFRQRKQKKNGDQFELQE